MDRRTRAPAPSDCEMARKDCRIARGIDMFEGALRDGSAGGTTGSPGKAVLDDCVLSFVAVVADIEAVDFVRVASCWRMLLRW
jgi:hypothetical protein